MKTAEVPGSDWSYNPRLRSDPSACPHKRIPKSHGEGSVLAPNCPGIPAFGGDPLLTGRVRNYVLTRVSEPAARDRRGKP
jgi:hypothetical protein